MPILSKSQRSPNEEFQYSNYPELLDVAEDINSLFAYLETVNTAVTAYQEDETDKIYLNVSEVQSMLNKSYDITDKLGSAPNVCFDVLMTIRSIQENLQELIYAHLSQGNYLVSELNPAIDTTSEDTSKEMI